MFHSKRWSLLVTQLRFLYSDLQFMTFPCIYNFPPYLYTFCIFISKLKLNIKKHFRELQVELFNGKSIQLWCLESTETKTQYCVGPNSTYTANSRPLAKMLNWQTYLITLLNYATKTVCVTICNLFSLKGSKNFKSFQNIFHNFTFIPGLPALCSWVPRERFNL